MSSSLQPHGLQHNRLPCPSLSFRFCSNSRPLSQWCYLTISSSAVLFWVLPGINLMFIFRRRTLHLSVLKRELMLIITQNVLLFFHMFCVCAHIQLKLFSFFEIMYFLILIPLIKRVSSVQFSRSVTSDSLRPHEPQHARTPCPSPTPGVHQSHWVGDTIQTSHPLSSPSPPALSLSQHQGLFKWVSSLHQVAKVLEFQFQCQSFQWTPRTDLLEDRLVGSPCSPRDSQECSPAPLFKSINSSVFSFLYSSTLTYIHDHWKNHSLD